MTPVERATPADVLVRSLRMSSGEIVTALIRANEARDVDAILALCTSDIEYENVPMSVMRGHAEIRAMLGPFLGSAERVEWEVLAQVEQGDLVMNERVDRFWLPGDVTVELRVAGIFQVRDGLVALWRDYFDLASFTEQMS